MRSKTGRSQASKPAPGYEGLSGTQAFVKFLDAELEKAKAHPRWYRIKMRTILWWQELLIKLHIRERHWIVQALEEIGYFENKTR
jgi:hypothetical protein